MSIATAITNAQNKVAAAYTALNAKGATMPVTQDLANMPTTISSIPDLFKDIKDEIADTVTLPFMSNPDVLAGLFYNNGTIKDLTIPTSYTRIGPYAFCGCSKIKRINSNTDGVFNLWEGITQLGMYCFYNCPKLTTINIPSTVTTIKGYSFQGCTSLVSLDLSNASNVTNIETSIFRGCTALTSVDMSAMTGLTTWNSYMFHSCSSLTNVVLPPNITSLSSYGFRDCTALPRITIPDACTTVGDYSFYNCNNLLEINFGNTRGTIPTLSNVRAFYTTNATTLSNRKIIVPDSLYTSWKAATNWKSTTYDIVNQIVKYSDYYTS